MTGPPWTGEFDRIVRTYCRLSDPAIAVDPCTSFNDLGVDSIGLLQIIVDSAELFDVEFPDELLTADILATPGTLWQALLTIVGQSHDNDNGDA